MTFAIIGCIAGIFAIEYLGSTFCRTRCEKTEIGGVVMACEVDGHIYTVSAPDAETACQMWAAYAADDECNFSWWDAELRIGPAYRVATAMIAAGKHLPLGNQKTVELA